MLRDGILRRIYGCAWSCDNLTTILIVWNESFGPCMCGLHNTHMRLYGRTCNGLTHLKGATEFHRWTCQKPKINWKNTTGKSNRALMRNESKWRIHSIFPSVMWSPPRYDFWVCGSKGCSISGLFLYSPSQAMFYSRFPEFLFLIIHELLLGLRYNSKFLEYSHTLHT